VITQIGTPNSTESPGHTFRNIHTIPIYYQYHKVKKMKNLKKIVLTGSSSGFGLITAKTLAKNGHTVYATMRNINGSNAATAQDLTDGQFITMWIYR